VYGKQWFRGTIAELPRPNMPDNYYAEADRPYAGIYFCSAIKLVKDEKEDGSAIAAKFGPAELPTPVEGPLPSPPARGTVKLGDRVDCLVAGVYGKQWFRGTIAELPRQNMPDNYYAEADRPYAGIYFCSAIRLVKDE